MFKNRKWLAILMALCMMITMMPAANMEEVVEAEAAYSAIMDDEIEMPDEIEGAVEEVVVVLGEAEGQSASDDAANAEIELEDGIESEDDVVESDAPDTVDGEADDEFASEEEADAEITEDGLEEVEQDDAAQAVAGPKITGQPKSYKGNFNTTAKFTVTASGSGLKYAWQYHKAGATKWTTITKKNSKNVSKSVTGFSTKKLEVKLTSENNGLVFRCKVTNSKGGVSYTKAVTMGTMKISTQPKSVTNGKLKKEYKFTVAASGSGLKYAWEYHKATGSKFTSITDKNKKTVGGSVSGFTSKTLKIKLLDATAGYVFRCKVTDNKGAVVYSDEVVLNTAAPKIKTQPKDFTGSGKASFTVAVTGGANVKCVWQYHKAGETKFVDITSKNKSKVGGSVAGFATKKLTIKSTSTTRKYVFRAKITATGYDPIYSDEVKIGGVIVKDGVTYEQVDGVWTVTKYEGTATSLTIPEKIEGNTVKAIGEGAFEGNAKLTSIDLPDTIEVIGKAAFKNCSKLSSMT